jgi:hypothetical protein
MSDIENEGAAALEVDASEQTGQDQEGKTEDELILDRHKALLDGIRTKHDEIVVFLAPRGFEQVGLVVISAPSNPKIFQNFVNLISKDSTDKAVATENFALSSVVHPDRETAKSIFKKKPAFALKVAARAQELAGSDTKELGKD